MYKYFWLIWFYAFVMLIEVIKLIPGSSCQVLVLPVGNVLAGPVVSILLSQSKVDQEEFVAVTPNTHQEVVWLDVTMDEILIVDVSVNKNN